MPPAWVIGTTRNSHMDLKAKAGTNPSGLCIGVNMQIHRGVLGQLNNQILPYALRVSGVGIPYAAELWVDGKVQFEDGTAIFSIEDDKFIVEFFAQGGTPFDGFYLGARQMLLILKGTEIRVPVISCKPSPKTQTIRGGSRIHQQGYQCELIGWIGGDENSPIGRAVLTITNLPRLSLPEKGMLLEADGWVIKLFSHPDNQDRESELLYEVELTRRDDQPFTLSNSDLNSGIIAALHSFLSFQSGYWVRIPTIVCHPPLETSVEKRCMPFPELDDIPGEISDGEMKGIQFRPLVERAWVGSLATQPPDYKPNAWTATKERYWPTLMSEYWRLFEDDNLGHSVNYYIRSTRLLSVDAGYSFIAIRSTLEALIRWWNGLRNKRLEGDEFIEELKSAVTKAELGLDSGKQIDLEELEVTYKKILNRYRNNIAHAHQLAEPPSAQIIADGHGFQWHLARMLILAKLGYRRAEAQGRFGFPSFVER